MSVASPDPSEVRIRNQRFRPWGTLVGLGLIASLFLAVTMVLVFPRLNTQAMARLILVGLLGMAVYTGYHWLLITDLQAGPRPGRRATARAAWRWAVLGIRGAELGSTPGRTIALAVLDWVLPTKLGVAYLKLGEGIEIDPVIRFPVETVRKVHFMADPDEDYVEPDRPIRFCLATIELKSGRQLRLIIDEADACTVRLWATDKGVAVSNAAGYGTGPT